MRARTFGCLRLQPCTPNTRTHTRTQRTRVGGGNMPLPLLNSLPVPLVVFNNMEKSKRDHSDADPGGVGHFGSSKKAHLNLLLNCTNDTSRGHTVVNRAR